MQIILGRHFFHKFCTFFQVWIFVMRCAILDQTLINGVRMVGQNAVLTSSNAFEWLSQESVSFNLFAWHSNSYLTFRMTWMTCKRISRKHSNCIICCKNYYIRFSKFEVKVKLKFEEQYSHQKLWSMCNISWELYVFC